MLKLSTVDVILFTVRQPPSGGCVLKHSTFAPHQGGMGQPPSGGCVLKHGLNDFLHVFFGQPPSGGCVLKQWCTQR